MLVIEKKECGSWGGFLSGTARHVSIFGYCFIDLFDYLEDHTTDGTKLRLYFQIGKGNQEKFDPHVTVRMLKLYKEYFDGTYWQIEIGLLYMMLLLVPCIITVYLHTVNQLWHMTDQHFVEGDKQKGCNCYDSWIGT